MPSTIYVLYNANGSAGGKLRYAYRKLTASPDQPSPCSACDLTHGGLRLTESKDWTATKRQIGAEVRQLHRDELDPELNDHVEGHGLRFPLVLGRADGGSLELLLDAQDLSGCAKDHGAFLALLRARCRDRAIDIGSEPATETKL